MSHRVARAGAAIICAEEKCNGYARALDVPVVEGAFTLEDLAKGLLQHCARYEPAKVLEPLVEAATVDTSWVTTTSEGVLDTGGRFSLAAIVFSVIAFAEASAALALGIIAATR